MVPQGPFELESQASRFGGWPRLGDAVVMAFPVEGWTSSAAVALRQEDGRIVGEVHGTAATDAERAWQQALACLSLDVDGSGFPEVGKRDPVIGRLQAEHQTLRPVLFHSPYEAACAFLIGHRITILQTRRIRQSLAEQKGRGIKVGDATFWAFPDPNALLQLQEFPGIASTKIERMHAAARAALDGKLDRAHLRSLPEPKALALLETLPGVGEFFAQAILMRGAGLVDAVTDDDLTPRAIELLYQLDHRPDREEVLRRARAWKPYRMWAVVLLNVWLRSQPPEVIGARRIRGKPQVGGRRTGAVRAKPRRRAK
jgi:DNA-3-methyladenine glycosylase II